MGRGLPAAPCAWLLVAWVTLSSLGCGSSPIAPPPPPPPTPAAPTIGCPLSSMQDGVLGGQAIVDFGAPVVAGGQAPVATVCTPKTGTAFPIGDTTVTCTATDALARQASCSFTVTLAPRVLQAGSFMAFGDSTTEGENGAPGFSALFARPQILDLDHSYPTVLAQMLVSAFPAQDVSMVNLGCGGERVAVGADRLKYAMINYHPEVVLLLDGFNDLLGGGTSAVGGVVDGMRTMVQRARSGGARYIFLSTLWPPGSGRRMIDPQAILNVNAGLRQVAASEGAGLVDPYDDFIGHQAEYIADGLHLLPAGYQALAQKFDDAILGLASAPSGGTQSTISNSHTSSSSVTFRSCGS